MIHFLHQDRCHDASTREQRLIFLEKKDAEEILDNVGKPKSSLPSVENNVQQLYAKMERELGKIGILTKINHFFSGKRAADNKVNALLDEAAQKEIEAVTKTALTWMGMFRNRLTYSESVAMKHAVKERLRAEVASYIQERQEKLTKLKMAAGVSAKLKRMNTFIPVNTKEEKLRLSLDRVEQKLRKKRERSERWGRSIPEEWREASSMENTLKASLIRYGVVSPAHLETYLQQNAEGSSSLINAIKGASFIDPEDPDPKEPHRQEKELCLAVAKKLSAGLFNRTYTGYRAFRLTQKTGNELSLPKRLEYLAQKDNVIGTGVELRADGVGMFKAHVVARDRQFPEALILRGSGAAQYVLDTKTGRLTFRDGTGKFRHNILDEKSFSLAA